MKRIFNRTFASLLAVAVLTVLAIYQNNERMDASLVYAQEAQPKKGYAAPAFDLPDLSDSAVKVGGAHDKLIMINFWASWCGPCELEAPDLEELHHTYQEDLIIYGVNATAYDREREARAFVDDFGLSFPILMDRAGDVTELYKVAQFPTTLLVDRQGVIRERITGVIPKADWERRIEKWNRLDAPAEN